MVSRANHSLKNDYESISKGDQPLSRKANTINSQDKKNIASI